MVLQGQSAADVHHPMNIHTMPTKKPISNDAKKTITPSIIMAKNLRPKPITSTFLTSGFVVVDLGSISLPPWVVLEYSPLNEI
jgi:hypothetical protein